MNVLLKNQKKIQESVRRMTKETFFYTRNNEQSSNKRSAQRTEVYKSKNSKEKEKTFTVSSSKSRESR